MIVSVQINNRTYRIDVNNPINVSIPLDFAGAQPNAYGVERAAAAPCEAGSLIGDTRRGGSCNFQKITFIPHCNGTHTESVGHVTHERISIHDSLKDAFIPATLVSIKPENCLSSGENYSIKLDDGDEFITKTSLENALKNVDENFLRGLIVRTLPNEESKKSRSYAESTPPFFSTEAINFIAVKGVEHLLVDMPSIDRTFDEGKLSNHRVFWNVTLESYELNRASYANKTITEMIYVPNEIEDDAYLLNLQIASFVSDASPSRPILFRISA